MGGVLPVSGVVDAVGAALLAVVVPGEDREVRDVTLAELDEPPSGQPGDLVLGVGVGDASRVRLLLDRADAAGAAGVVLRARAAAGPEVRAAAARRGLALVELRGDATWAQLVWLLRGVVDRAAGATQPAADGTAGVYDELFALADAAAAIIDAPVTIEDAASRVLAYSARQDRADSARVSTIVGRRVPGDVLAHFRSRGVFRKLARGSEPVFVPAGPDGTLPRLVLPVRAGGELLGSIWAVVDGPVPDDRLRELGGAASALALHLLRLRVQADVARRVAADRLRAALLGAVEAADAELGLPPAPWRVVALGAHAGVGEPLHQLAVWESLARRHGWRAPLVTSVGDVLLALVQERGTGPGSWPWLERLIADVAVHDAGLRAASGGVAASVAELPRSRAEAAELLSLHAAAGAAPGTSPVGALLRFEDAWPDVVLHRAVTALPADQLLVGGPLPALMASDAGAGTDYVATLRAWLEQAGDVGRAAAQLHVHPNTLRYRLRRMAAVAPLELDSPSARLALQLQLAAVAR
jgi:hypothetical protein